MKPFAAMLATLVCLSLASEAAGQALNPMSPRARRQAAMQDQQIVLDILKLEVDAGTAALAGASLSNGEQARPGTKAECAKLAESVKLFDEAMQLAATSQLSGPVNGETKEDMVQRIAGTRANVVGLQKKRCVK